MINKITMMTGRKTPKTHEYKNNDRTIDPAILLHHFFSWPNLETDHSPLKSGSINDGLDVIDYGVAFAAIWVFVTAVGLYGLVEDMLRKQCFWFLERQSTPVAAITHVLLQEI